MTDAPFPRLSSDMAAQLDRLRPPALPDDFEDRLIAAAQQPAALPVKSWPRRSRRRWVALGLVLGGTLSMAAVAMTVPTERLRQVPVLGAIVEWLAPKPDTPKVERRPDLPLPGAGRAPASGERAPSRPAPAMDATPAAAPNAPSRAPVMGEARPPAPALPVTPSPQRQTGMPTRELRTESLPLREPVRPGRAETPAAVPAPPPARSAEPAPVAEPVPQRRAATPIEPPTRTNAMPARTPPPPEVREPRRRLPDTPVQRTPQRTPTERQRPPARERTRSN